MIFSLDIIEQLEIVAIQAHAEFQAILMWMCLSSLGAGLVALCVWQLAKFGGRVRKTVLLLGPVGCSLVIPGFVKLYVYGSTKPTPVTPQITWDSGLSNNGSHFDTNNWSTIHFRWNKDITIANEEPVYFAAKHKDYPDLEYDEIGQSTASQRSWDYTFTGGANATNYLYYVFTIGEVHTNGVWIGNILQKITPGMCGPDKMVIMKSRLEVNGKQIAPFKEK